MFLVKKKNKSGSCSVIVVKKVGRRNVPVKTIGCATDGAGIDMLMARGERWIEERLFGVPLFEVNTAAAEYDRVMAELGKSTLRLVGPELIYGTLFDRIGYSHVKTSDNDLFRALVLTRLYHPGSKLRSAEYMAQFLHKEYSVDAIYRFLDKLCVKGSTAEDVRAATDESVGVKWQVEQIAFEHTRKRMGGTVSVVFYDTSTLYFESQEDDVRIPGYSKDGKNENPQVVLGLLVGAGGNPIGYEIHKGNQYEGTTMLPIIKKMERRFGLPQPTVIADAGLLNKQNIKELEEGHYKYILGARIKSLPKADKETILSLGLSDGGASSVILGGKRYVISMSGSRAAKDAKDRAKGLARLEKRFRSGKITKSSVNNRGYNRFLSLEGETTVSVDLSKIAEDARFDGLKGYVTNSDLPDADIIDNYHNLYLIERAFRMNKTDLAIRPIYHRLFNRIEAHVCICFAAYTVMLELERALKAAQSPITLYRAQFLAETIFEIEYVNPYNGQSRAVRLNTGHDEEVAGLLEAVNTP